MWGREYSSTYSEILEQRKVNGLPHFPATLLWRKKAIYPQYRIDKEKNRGSKLEFWDSPDIIRKIEERRWNFGTSRHK